MSLEAWGDDGAEELPDGCWYPDQVEIVLECIKELVAEPVYEGGRMENGISTRFLARLTVLQANAGLLEADNPLVREAEAMFASPEYSEITSGKT